jgi:hypothetical protein
VHGRDRSPEARPVAELTQLTAPNEAVEAANGVTYPYRRFGNAERGAPPVLDNWDPQRRWRTTRWRWSTPSACGRSTCSGSRSAGSSPRRSPLTRPQLVRRLVLAGTGPQGGERMHGWSSEVFEMAMADGQAPSERLLVQAVARADRPRGSSQYRPEPGCG